MKAYVTCIPTAAFGKEGASPWCSALVPGGSVPGDGLLTNYMQELRASGWEKIVQVCLRLPPMPQLLSSSRAICMTRSHADAASARLGARDGSSQDRRAGEQCLQPSSDRLDSTAWLWEVFSRLSPNISYHT